MSESFICRRGGGKPFAVIGATYPSGSTCTCTNGTKTLKAKDTSGQALFVIPSTGTWTVTCTNGTDTASEAVSITADGQTKTVTLLYELVLFDADNGGDNTTVTGGWNSIEESGSTITYTQPYSYLYLKDVWRSTLYPKNAVDVSKYTKLNVSVKKTGGGQSKAWVMLTPTKPATDPSTSISVGTGLDIAAYTEQTTVALDISANSGANYIVLYCNFTEVAIYRIWLT